MKAAAVALALGALLVAPTAAALERLPAILHAHSDLSTGDFPLEDLVRLAERQEIEALLLSDNYLLRVEYGLPPFRALTRVAAEAPSVLGLGIERYLARVDEVRRRHRRVLIVPGVEVVPHYRWTGSPLGLNLTLHDSQKNLLVFGVTDPALLARLPVIGNRSEPIYTWQSGLDALPGLLVLPGLVLLLRRRAHRRRLGPTVVIVRRRAWLAGGLLVGLGALALVRGWPFTVDRYPPWGDYGIEPHQALIDHVEGLGGAAVWSFPEAVDSGDRNLGPLRVTWHTQPYSDDLLRTARYTAFGGLYEQAVRVVDPGGLWDRLLTQYAGGERSRPAWAVGESGFHGFTAGKRVGTVQTVFLVEERSEAGVLAALRNGRLYALQRTPEAGLVLADYSVAAAGAVARSGDRLPVAAGTPLEVGVAVEAGAGATLPVRVSLVRNGAVVEAWAGQTPFRAVYREPADGAPTVFRVDVRSTPPHRLLSSPIFVTRP